MPVGRLVMEGRSTKPRFLVETGSPHNAITSASSISSLTNRLPQRSAHASLASNIALQAATTRMIWLIVGSIIAYLLDKSTDMHRDLCTDLWKLPPGTLENPGDVTWTTSQENNSFDFALRPGAGTTTNQNSTATTYSDFGNSAFESNGPN